jgi:hypothetical protein
VTAAAAPPRIRRTRKGYFHAEKIQFVLTRQRQKLSAIGDENALLMKAKDDISAVRGD